MNQGTGVKEIYSESFKSVTETEFSIVFYG